MSAQILNDLIPDQGDVMFGGAVAVVRVGLSVLGQNTMVRELIPAAILQTLDIDGSDMITAAIHGFTTGVLARTAGKVALNLAGIQV